MLAKVEGVFNAVQVDGDLSGKVIFYGRGAGSDPTANVVVADAIHLARNINLGISEKPQVPLASDKAIRPMGELETRYFIRLTGEDRPGVLGQISKILGDCSISISAAIQEEADPATQTAEIVIMTHPAKERAVQEALAAMKDLPVVKEIGNFIRVEA